jgi:pyruvate-formate lyase
MIHNDIQYWRHLQSLPADHEDLPTARVCRLLRRLFQRWREKPRWLREEDTGHLFRNKDEKEPRLVAEMPLIRRKGSAVRRMLEIVVDDTVAERAGSCEVDPDELIIGTMPPFSVGQGKEFVRYLTREEELEGMLDYLNELSPMGHIVPDHNRVVKLGLQALIDQCTERYESAANEDSDRRDFYLACRESLEGVIAFANAYADKVDQLMKTLPADDGRLGALGEVAKRLRRVPAGKCESFHDAVQAIYLVHCALHWTVEVVPLGRLDQILWPFLDADLKSKRITVAKAQEILDCLWIKLDEPAILNFRHAENRFTACDGVLTGFWGASNYDQGGLLNQWMQQVTIGGVLPDANDQATDASNLVTKLCLESSRRLPLNAPTLDLRVHRGTPEDVLALAARTVLSGGAHPVLLNDECIVTALQRNSNGVIDLASARDYACDGCYETMIAGRSEFSFGFVSATDLIEKTLNRGAGIGAAGPIHLRGFKDSWRSPSANEISNWDQFMGVYVDHMELGCHRYLRNLIRNYGNKITVCPSPLLSVFIGGCLESGRDLTAGGADFHIFSPLFTSISTAADSLYVIKTLVFEQNAFSLDELLACLVSNWGENLISKDRVDQPAFGRYVEQRRIEEIHKLCLIQPKFGFGNKQVDEIAWDLIERFCNCVEKVHCHSLHAKALDELSAKWSTPEKPFKVVLAPGVGTFEQYVFAGSFLGASADGRKAGQPVASDLSPAPLHRFEDPQDAEAGLRHRRTGALKNAFKSYGHPCMERLGDGGAVDYNIPEDFSPAKLADLMRDFADGGKGSVATFTAADPETLKKAQESPGDFNLVRVRMGGWSEFFVTLFPDHQSQHRRRPLYTA